jgi:thiamine-phosphate pyrophosphorylase
LPSLSFNSCQLYLITPPAIPDLPLFARALAEALEAGPVSALQVRLKDASDTEIADAVSVIGPLARARGVTLVLNDRPDLAASLGCDGVHIGQEDASYEEARHAIGDLGVVGVTCHANPSLAVTAAQAGADYVAFGAFFPTLTKVAPASAAPEILTRWRRTLATPCVAIGGIEVGNCRALIAAGAHYLAVSRGVWGFPRGAAAAVELFCQEMTNGCRGP